MEASSRSTSEEKLVDTSGNHSVAVPPKNEINNNDNVRILTNDRSGCHTAMDNIIVPPDLSPLYQY